jgi:hypothetical protein
MQPQGNDNSMEMMMAMMQMMGSMNQQQQMPQQPEVLPAPEVETVEPVDWSSQSEELRRAVRFSEESAEDSDRTRVNTLHAGEEDEEALTTESLLNGTDEQA